MATKSIEERANEASKILTREEHRRWYRVGYIHACTEQDRISRQEEREKAIRILRQLGVFDILAAEEGLSAACMEEQFKQSMEGGAS